MRGRVIAWGALALVLAACAAPGQPAATTTASTQGSAAVATNRATVTGSVKVPNGLVAAGGMNLVAAGGMNLVAAGGMNLVAAGGMNLVAAGGMNLTSTNKAGLVAAGGMNYALQATAEQPLAGVVVFLCDGLGRPIAGLPPVATDAEGRYAIPEVPMGFTLVVNALVPYQNGDRALLTALVRSGRPDPVEVDAASTLTAIRAAAIRKDGQLGEFEANVFRSAVGDVRNALTDATTPDYRDAEEVGRRAAEIEGAVDGLSKKLDALRATIAMGPGAAAPLPTGSTAPLPSPSAKALDGACSDPVTHTFKVQDLTRNGVAIVIRERVQGQPERKLWPVKAESKLTAGAAAPIALPEGCAYRVELLDAFGQIVIADDAWTVPPGSAAEVALPF